MGDVERVDISKPAPFAIPRTRDEPCVGHRMAPECISPSRFVGVTWWTERMALVPELAICARRDLAKMVA